jgi:hypothetical protein
MPPHGHDEAQLIAKLLKIEALFARPATDGERGAAASALERIRARLRALERTERPIEFRVSLADAWSRSLFIALLQRYGLRPYRHRGQRHTTVMVRVTQSFFDQTLWPEFQQCQAVLHEHFEAVTRRVIAEALGRSGADVELRDGTGSFGAEPTPHGGA